MPGRCDCQRVVRLGVLRLSLRKLRILLLRLSGIPLVFLAVFVRPRWRVGSDVAFAVEFIGYLFLLAGGAGEGGENGPCLIFRAQVVSFCHAFSGASGGAAFSG